MKKSSTNISFSLMTVLLKKYIIQILYFYFKK